MARTGTKLTQEQVNEIRDTDTPARELAERFGVSLPLIYGIRARKYHRQPGDPEYKPGKVGRPKLPPKLCECGCGGEVNHRSCRFIGRHYMDVPEIRERIMRGLRPNKSRTDEETIRDLLANTIEKDRGYGTPCLLHQGPIHESSTRRYPAFVYNGKQTTAHRVAYMAHHGVTLPPTVHVGHLCERKNDPEGKRCVNVHHLAAMTPGENVRQALSSLTVEDVLLIRHSTKTNVELAKQYRMSPKSIGNIRNGHRWGAVDG